MAIYRQKGGKTAEKETVWMLNGGKLREVETIWKLIAGRLVMIYESIRNSLSGGWWGHGHGWEHGTGWGERRKS